MDSKTIFSIRNEAKNLDGTAKIQKLNEALNLARRFFNEDPSDEWGQKAYAWVLIDLCKCYVQKKMINDAFQYFEELKQLDLIEYDEIITKQIKFLIPKVTVGYEKVKQAEEISKNGRYKDAIDLFKDLKKNGVLKDAHHESYGWAIQRYLQNESDHLDSIQVRKCLLEYIKLKNERPSLLHSVILSFAVNYSVSDPKFDLFSFFKIWNPKHLRTDDNFEETNDGKTYPSLISKLLRRIVEVDKEIDVEFLISNIELGYNSRIEVLDMLREQYFWKLYNYHKADDLQGLWSSFEKYLELFSNYEHTKWHSEILGLAERVMIEENEYKFFEFLKTWGTTAFTDKDWQEVKKGENTYKPLAVKCLKKAFGIAKSIEGNSQDLDWLLEGYFEAINKYPNDEWILREKALLLLMCGKVDKAISDFKSLVLILGDKDYVWNEFSSCFKFEEKVKMGMLCKALLLAQSDEYLGDLRLYLAEAMIQHGYEERAILEIQSYENYRHEKGWKMSQKLTDLKNKITTSNTDYDNNFDFYKEHSELAEKFAYSEIPWTEMILIDKWKDQKNRNRMKFTDGEGIDLIVSKKRVKSFDDLNIGSIVNVKIHSQPIENPSKNKQAKYLDHFNTPKKPISYKHKLLQIKPSSIEDWSILDDGFAVIDYINKEKSVLHLITPENKEVFIKCDIDKYNVGDFVVGKKYKVLKDGEEYSEIVNVKTINQEDGLKAFPEYLAIVDHVNNEKKLFHYVVDKNIDGLIFFKDTDLRPNEGDFLKIKLAGKKNRKDSTMLYNVLDVKETDEVNPNLLKTETGHLTVNFKSHNNGITPDFGFVNDNYVHQDLLKEKGIVADQMVKVKLIYSGSEWKVLDIYDYEVPK